MADKVDLEAIEVGKKYTFTLKVTGTLAGISVSYDEACTMTGQRFSIIGNLRYGELSIIDPLGQRHDLPCQVIVEVERI